MSTVLHGAAPLAVLLATAGASAAAGAADTSSPQWIVSLIKDVGVPIAMLVWFALRVERKLDEINASHLAAMERGREAQIETAKALQRAASAMEQVDHHLDSGVHHLTPEQRRQLAAKGGG